MSTPQMDDPTDHFNPTVSPRYPVILCGLVLLSTLIPFLANWGTIGVADYDQFATFNLIALWWHDLGDTSVTWNPFLCGGATLVGNPQIPLFHPNMLLYRLFGPGNALGLTFLPWGAAGYAATYFLARDHGLRRAPAAWIGAAWVLNGFFIGHLGSMHVLYTAFHCTPLLFLLNRALARRGDLRAAAAMPFALAIPALYNHHFLAYGFPFAVLHFGVESWFARGRPPVLKKVGLYAAALFLAVGMLALFLLPSMRWNLEFPRFLPGEFEPPLNLLQMLLLPLQIVPLDVEHGMFERYYVIGPVLFGFLVLGFWRGLWRERRLRPLLIIAVVAFVTAIGSLEPFGLPPLMPVDLLRAVVPGYQAIRVPSRFFINAVPALLLLIGLEWQHRARTWSPWRRRWVLAAALVPLWLFNAAYFQLSLFSEARSLDVPRPPASVAADFRWAPLGYRHRMMRVIQPNVGVLDCYEALEVPTAEALDPDAGFVLEAPPSVRVERLNWGELRVSTADGASIRSAEVRFNFNHHRGWQVLETDGAAEVVSSSREPLTVRLDGAGYARLGHLDPSWRRGVLISLVALAAALAFTLACLGFARRRARVGHAPDRM